MNNQEFFPNNFWQNLSKDPVLCIVHGLTGDLA